MSRNFNVGDTVRCIDDKQSDKYITLGGIYKVRKTGIQNNIPRVNIEGSITDYYASRFEFVGGVNEKPYYIVEMKITKVMGLEQISTIIDRQRTDNISLSLNTDFVNVTI